MNHNYLLRCEQKIWFSWAVYNFPFTSPLIFEPKNKWKTSKPHRFSWRFFPCQLHPLVKRSLFKAPCEPQPSVWLSVGSSWPANLCKLWRELGGEVVKGRKQGFFWGELYRCCTVDAVDGEWWMVDDDDRTLFSWTRLLQSQWINGAMNGGCFLRTHSEVAMQNYFQKNRFWSKNFKFFNLLI